LKRGEIAAAQGETESALRRYPSEQTEWHWRFRLLKAEILHRKGQNNEALALVGPELPAGIVNSELTIRRKLVQGAASALTQRLPEAGRFLDEAEALGETDDPDLLGEIALRRGTVWFLAGDLNEAEAAYRRSLRIARGKKDQFLEAAALEGLGVVATKKEHYDEAIDWERAALQAARSAGAQHSLAQILGNMAWNYRKLGDFENALVLYKQAEEASAQNGAAGDQLYWLTGIENVYFLQHDYAAAQSVLEQALDMARRQDDKGTLMEFLNDLSELAVEAGNVALAERYLTEASQVAAVNPDPSEILQSMLIRGRILESRHEYASAANCFRELISDSKVGSSQKWEAEAHLAKIYAEESFNVQAEREFRRSLDTIETVRSSVQSEELRLSFLSTAISFYGDYMEFLISQGRVVEALEVADLSRARTLAEGLPSRAKPFSLSPNTVRPLQIARRLNAVLLFYWVGEQQSYLWVITPVKLSCFRLPGRPILEPTVNAYRRAILDGHDVLSAEDTNGKQLYAMMLNPARSLIPKNSRVILVSAEGLYGLNFETLIVPEPRPHFWIEDVTISEAGSLALLSTAAEKVAGAKRTLLLVGNPEPSEPDFPFLAQAPTEMQKVSAHFPPSQCTVLQGKRATPSAYFHSGPERFAYLHFVTHGTASHTRPLESAVILSSDGDAFKLYARDIVAHPVQAELVTISACNGAGTRAYAGEGLVGLSWAFLRAGARNVVASLWEVSDASSTGQLMDAFYSGLDRGEDPAAALREAKLFTLKSNFNTVFRKPFYWAPFQLYVGS